MRGKQAIYESTAGAEALYMAATTAIRWDKENLKPYYQNLRAREKPIR